jgi:YfiH family protein
MVTTVPGVALGILTADCAPVLFADTGAGVIGAAHAGWRGAKDGILEATVAAMLRLGARSRAIVCAVGPCIRQASYEVGPELRATFVADEPAAADLFAPAVRADHWQFDHAGYVARRLAALGLAAIEVLPDDTYADRARFFSFRRVTHEGGGDYGRLLSAIVLAA